MSSKRNILQMSEFVDFSQCEMSSNVQINQISNEDFYNDLYWDYRIYDIRSLEEYNRSHICRAHHIDCSSIDILYNMDTQIDHHYGKPDNPSSVLIYDNNSFEISLLISYLKSSKNPLNKYLKEIKMLINGFESFHLIYPYLCSDHLYFDQSCQLSWPSCITSSIYLGSSMSRNEMIISLLKITHIISLTDYQEEILQLTNIKTIHYQISDSLSSNIYPIFDSAISWISKCLNDDKGILLIHCEQGVSRSVIVLMSYLLHSNEYFHSVDDVYQFVKSKRSIIKPNESFLKQLKEYSMKI